MYIPFIEWQNKINYYNFTQNQLCFLLFTALFSAIEHALADLITPFHSESTADSIDINKRILSPYEKIPKISENPLIIDLVFHQNFAIFAMCSKH